MKRITIILKSGARFSFNCRNFDVSYSTQDGTVLSYKAEGVRGESPQYIVPPEIAAVLVKS